MAKKKVDPVNATESDRQVSPRVVFLLPQDLLDLIDEQAEANDRTRTAEILRALKSYYTGQRLWPRQGASEH